MCIASFICFSHSFSVIDFIACIFLCIQYFFLTSFLMFLRFMETMPVHILALLRTCPFQFYRGQCFVLFPNEF